MFTHQKLLGRILKAGISENGKITKNTSGTPQGGTVSPILANIALNGIEDVLLKGRCLPIRYADDLIVLGKNKSELSEIIPVVEEFIAERGLTLNKEKSTLSSISDGFNFLGFFFKEYSDGRKPGRLGKLGKFILTPKAIKVKLLRHRLKDIFKKHRRLPKYNLICKLNPILRGWANYFKYSSATVIFNSIGLYLYKLIFARIKSEMGRSKSGIRNRIKNEFGRDELKKRIWSAVIPGSLTKRIPMFDIQSVKMQRENVLKFNPSPNPYLVEFKDIFDKKLKSALLRDENLNKVYTNLLRKQKGVCIVCKTNLENFSEFKVVKSLKSLKQRNARS